MRGSPRSAEYVAMTSATSHLILPDGMNVRHSSHLLQCFYIDRCAGPTGSPLRSCRTMCTVWTDGSPRISEGRRRGVQEHQVKEAFVRGGNRLPPCPVAPLVDRGQAEAVRADG